jgi:hypothetical protein
MRVYDGNDVHCVLAVYFGYCSDIGTVRFLWCAESCALLYLTANISTYVLSICSRRGPQRYGAVAFYSPQIQMRSTMLVYAILQSYQLLKWLVYVLKARIFRHPHPLLAFTSHLHVLELILALVLSEPIHNAAFGDCDAVQPLD